MGSIRDMNLRNQLESFLSDKIPLATAMGVRVVTLEPLMLEAPVALNSNHLGTAFGGSINAVATLVGYALLWLALHDDPSIPDRCAAFPSRSDKRSQKAISRQNGSGSRMRVALQSSRAERGPHIRRESYSTLCEVERSLGPSRTCIVRAARDDEARH